MVAIVMSYNLAVNRPTRILIFRGFVYPWTFFTVLSITQLIEEKKQLRIFVNLFVSFCFTHSFQLVQINS